MKNFLLFICVLNLSFLVYSQQNTNEYENIEQLLYEANRSQPDKAISICKSIEPKVKNNPILLGKAYDFIGQAYWQKGDYNKSIVYAKKAIKEHRKSNQPDFESNSYKLIAECYNTLGLRDEGLDAIDFGVKIIQQHKNHKNYHAAIGNIYSAKAGFYSELDSLIKYDRLSLYHFQKANSIDSRHLAQAYVNLASDYIADHENPKNIQPDSALYLLRKANELNITERDYIYIIFNEAKAYFYKKEYKTAENLYFTTIERAKKIDEVYLLKDTYLRLKELYEAVENKEKELFYSNKYQAIKDSLVNLERSSLNQEVKNIKKEQQQSFFKTKHELIFVILCILLLLIISVFISVRNHKKTKIQYAQFKEIIAELENKKVINEESVSISADRASAPNVFIAINENKKSYSSITEQKEEQLLKKLEKFENSEKYTNKDLSISLLATQLGTNITYLSETINKHKGKNYNQYINELRIHYIIQKLKGEYKFRQYKIAALAEECGFNSHSVFSTVFNSIVGMPPSRFIKFIQKEKIPES